MFTRVRNNCMHLANEYIHWRIAYCENTSYWNCRVCLRRLVTQPLDVIWLGAGVCIWWYIWGETLKKPRQ